MSTHFKKKKKKEGGGSEIIGIRNMLSVVWGWRGTHKGLLILSLPFLPSLHLLAWEGGSNLPCLPLEQTKAFAEAVYAP